MFITTKRTKLYPDPSILFCLYQYNGVSLPEMYRNEYQ